MGKKKVVQKAESAEPEKIKETSTAVSRSSKQKYENGRVYIQASYNNTVMTVTDDKGNVLAWATAGSLGFSGPKKATPFAASKIISVIAEKLRTLEVKDIEVWVRGIGGGKDSAIRSLAGQGFAITRIKDVTPIPHNGPRPKKVRRV